ncbi:MAG TPA: HlyD family efflux transporter periplasmic adaptor subunit [Gemmataceae bacterium]|nr:HlyD family efflux transporter periplasmic adaptor subunit [Gemmataceae bacterium]
MAKLMPRSGLVRVSLVLLLILGIAGVGCGTKSTSNTSAKADHAEKSDDLELSDITVMAAHPHNDKSFAMTVTRPADVLAYYRDDLASLVPGVISMINADKGDKVKKDEVLIEVNVPDLKARVKEQEANLKLAEAQVKQKVAAIESAKAELDVIEAKINAAIAKRNSDKAYLVFRQAQAKRFEELSKNNSIDARLVDEQMDRREAAFEAVNAAEEAVKSARAQKIAAGAKIEQAKADREEAERKVEVMQAELDHAKVMVGFATIKAPYDGEIVDRNDRHANVGAIVQKAESGTLTPLLTVQRSDIVRVVVRVPDNYAHFVTPDTEAIFETPELPGVKIHGKVTRYPKSLNNPQHDRTLRVEVDLWNRSKEDYDKKMADPDFTSHLRKSKSSDPKKGLPILPEFKFAPGAKGKLAPGERPQLLPGMFGEMTLVLKQFESARLLPSSAIVSQGGRPYIYLVKDGKAHLQPVDVQVDDGKLAKVELVDEKGNVAEEQLTGKEVVIISNQGELSEGQPVKATIHDNDWQALNKAAKKAH